MAEASSTPMAEGNATAGATPGAAAAAGAAKKRAPPTHEGQGDAKRRRADFSVGDRGVFFTTVTPAGTGNARRDLVRLLEDSLEADLAAEGRSTAASAAEAKDGASAGAKLEAELQQLQTTKPSFSLCSHEVAKGTGFIRFGADAANRWPSKVVERLLAAQRAEFEATQMAASSRLLCRVLPIDYTCKPFVDDFRKLAEAVLPAHVGPEAEPTVWALEFKARNTNTLKKEAVLDVIDSIVPKGRHKVNLTDPVKCILVEVNPLFCGLTVISRWAQLKKYNLHALTTSEEERKACLPKAAPKAAAPQPAAEPAPSAAAAAPKAAAGAPEPAAPAADAAAPAKPEAEATNAAAAGTPRPEEAAAVGTAPPP